MLSKHIYLQSPDFSGLWSASVVGRASSGLTWSQTPEDQFSRDAAQYYIISLLRYIVR